MPNMTVFDEEKSVFFSMAESDFAVAGGCTQAWWDAEVESIGAAAAMAKLMNVSNGLPIQHEAHAVYTDSTKRFEDADIHNGVEVGMVLYAEENGVGGNIETGMYTVSGVGTNWIECDGIEGSDAPDVEVIIGGAVGGLQDALDETDATDHSVTIYVNSAPILVDPIGADSGGGSNANNTFKRIVGFNTVPGDMGYGGEYYESPEEILQNGSIDSTKTVTFDADEQGGFGERLINVGVDNLIFENLHFCNLPDYSAVVFSGTPKNIVFRNCRFSNAARVLGSAANFLLMDSCYSHNDITEHQYLISGETNVLLNCVANVKTGTNFANFNSQPGVVIGCIIKGGNYGIRTTGAASCSVLVIGNTFYNVPTYGICTDGGNVTVFNNIFCLAPGVIALYLRSGGMVLYNDYNCFIESDGTPLTVGGNSGGGREVPVIGPHSIEVDPDFVDAANGDFRVRNPLLLRGGRPGPDGKATVIGAIGQEYQFAARARMVNAGRAGIIR